MSTNQKESGWIKIPSKEWSPLKKTLMDHHNNYQDELLETMKKLFVYLKTEYKGKRNLNVNEILMDLTPKQYRIDGKKMTEADLKYLNVSKDANNCVLYKDFDKVSIDLRDWGDDQFSELYGRLIKNGKIVKPKKQDFNYVNAKTISYDVGDCAEIYLDNENKTVQWNVPYNNHAVDDAHRHPLAKALFRKLNSIKFTRNTGGDIWGNDEHNFYESNGQQYKTASFGVEKKTKRLKRGF